MRTLYIDIYFLINFAIDLISVYFATVISLIPSSQKRLIFSAFVGAVLAVVIVFIPAFWFNGVIAAFVYVLSLIAILTKGVGIYRKIKFVASFFIVEFVLGGFVQFFYGILDKHILAFFEGFSEPASNRRLLFLALIVLLSVGMLRIISSLFYSRSCCGTVFVDMSFEGKCISFEAFCDTGNMAKDPLDLSPVIFVKRTVIEPVLPHNLLSALNFEEELASLDYGIKKKIRMLPVKRVDKTGIMLSIKPDSISIARKENGKRAKIRATVAIDNEGGTYGGYYGLIPSAAIGDVLV